MGQNWLEDYMKFKGITPLGIVVYPFVAAIVGVLLVSMYTLKLTYWIRKKIKRKRS